jgi:hypothetical protein
MALRGATGHEHDGTGQYKESAVFLRLSHVAVKRRPKPNRVALFSSLDFLFDFLDSPFRQAPQRGIPYFEGRTIDIW